MAKPIIALLLAAFGIFAANRDARVRQLEAELLAAEGAARVEYSARQCMVTVARGDYDDFLRRLGWQRGGAR